MIVSRFSDELCTKQIFTSELIDGVPVDKCADMDVDVREHICKLIMELCLKELFEFKYMQTDPNWSNFFYNFKTKQVKFFDISLPKNILSNFTILSLNFDHFFQCAEKFCHVFIYFAKIQNHLS